jgi:xanthine/uracil permease
MKLGIMLCVVIGGTYAFILPTVSIISSTRNQRIISNRVIFFHTMRGIQGSLIVSSTLQIILGFNGMWDIVVRYLSPLSFVPLVSLIALGGEVSYRLAGSSAIRNKRLEQAT